MAVLGGRRCEGLGCRAPSGPSARRQRLQLPACEERRARRLGPGRPLAHAPAPRGLGGHPGVSRTTRARPAPLQARLGTISAEEPHPCLLAKQGAELGIGDIFCLEGRRRLESVPLDSAFRIRIDAQLRLVDAFEEEVDAVGAELRRRLKAHQGYQAIQAIPAVRPVIGATMVAEIGDVNRFPSPRHLCARGPG